MASDLLSEEDGGELADVRGLGGAEVVDEGGNDSGVLGQPLDLLLCLPPRVVVRHQELNKQQFQRLCHRRRRRLPYTPLLVFQIVVGCRSRERGRNIYSGNPINSSSAALVFFLLKKKGFSDYLGVKNTINNILLFNMKINLFSIKQSTRTLK